MSMHLLLRVITAADHRPRFHVPNSLRLSARFPIREFIWVNPAGDWEMLRRRPQVLAERQNLASDGYQIVQHLIDLIVPLAEAQHHPCFGNKSLAFGDLKEF